MRKPAMVILSVLVFTAQLGTFVGAANEPSTVGQTRIITVVKDENRQEQRPTPPASLQPEQHLAFQELQSVSEEAQHLQNKTDVFKVLSKSANLLWLYSPR